MERTQFTFYGSFFKAISRIKKKSDRADAYDAICAYALYGEGPDLEKMPDAAAIAFELSKPNLDASRRKATSGKKGGSTKQAGSKQEANGKQTASKKEEEKKKEKEIENECYPPNPLSVVVSAYLSKINPAASQTSMDELKAYVEQLGPDVCLRAFDVALDAKKANWPYIRAILRDKLTRGVKCLADWEALEEKREETPQGRKSWADLAAEMDAEEGMA